MTRCWLSETHLAINPQGLVGPCCRNSGKETQLSLENKTIDQVFEDEKLVDIRNRLRNNERVAECRKCWIQEDAGILSMRQQFNTQADWDKLDSLDTFERIHSLEIAFSNHCNYRCRMCNTFFSSKWLKDDELLGNPVPDKLLLEPDLDFYQIDQLVNLHHIKMLGGEPFLSKQHKRLLQRIPLAQMYLEYVTNGSIWPDDEVVEMWKQVRRLRFIVSLDDIYEPFEYFRTDGDFATVERTFAHINELQKHRSVEPNIHCVINVLNMYRLDQIVEYLLTNLPNWNFTFDTLVHPEFLRVSQWSKHEGDTQIQKLQALSNSITGNSDLDNHKRRNIGKAIKIIQTNCVNETSNFDKLIETNSILDSSRNTKLETVHPRLLEV